MSVGAIRTGQMAAQPRFGKISDTQKAGLEKDAAMLKKHEALQKLAEDMTTPELVQALDTVMKEDPGVQTQSRPFGLPIKHSNPLFKMLEESLSERLIKLHERFSENTQVEETAKEAIEGIKRLENVEHYEIQDEEVFEAFRAAAVRAQQVLAQHEKNEKSDTGESKEPNPFRIPAEEAVIKAIDQPSPSHMVH